MPANAAPPPLPASARARQNFTLFPPELGWQIAIIVAFVGGFAAVFFGTLLFTRSQTKIYQAVASLVLERMERPAVSASSPNLDQPHAVEDINTTAKILESSKITQQVGDQLVGDDLQQFMAPYETGDGNSPILPEEILIENRRIVPVRESRVILVQYRHPDRQIAAKVANLFTEQLMAYYSRVRVGATLQAVQELQLRIKEQAGKVDDLANTLKAEGEKMAGSSTAADPRERQRQELEQRARQMEWETNEVVLEQIKTRLTDIQAAARIAESPVQILDKAYTPGEGDYISPNILLELGLGFGCALGTGFAAALVVAVMRLVFGRESAG